jgi:hypothetical protein
MTKSKNAQRAIQHAKMNAMMSGYNLSGRGANRVRDWIVGGSAINSSGGVIASPPTTWTNGSGAAFNLINGGAFSYQAVVIQPAPASGTPGIGRLRIDQIKGRLMFAKANGASVFTAGGAMIAVGIYVSEVNQTTTNWHVRNPLVPADVCRDDYLFLEAHFMDIPPLGNNLGSVTGFLPEINLSIDRPVVIGGGQALHVTVSCSSSDSDTYLLVMSAFRSKVGPVA